MNRLTIILAVVLLLVALASLGCGGGGRKYVADGDVTVSDCHRNVEGDRVCTLSVFFRNDGDEDSRPVVVHIESAAGGGCTTTVAYPPNAKGYGDNPNGGATVRADCTGPMDPKGPFTVSFFVGR